VAQQLAFERRPFGPQIRRIPELCSGDEPVQLLIESAVMLGQQVSRPRRIRYHYRMFVGFHEQTREPFSCQANWCAGQKVVEVEDFLGPAQAWSILRDSLELYRRLRRGELAR